MGSGSSKVDTDEVRRCKVRKDHMKQTVAHRNKFAAAHADYVAALKNTGAAIYQFAELVEPQPETIASTSAAAMHTKLQPPPLPPTDAVHQPPPRPPNDAVHLEQTGDDVYDADDADDESDEEFERPLTRATSMPVQAVAELAASLDRKAQADQQLPRNRPNIKSKPKLKTPPRPNVIAAQPDSKKVDITSQPTTGDFGSCLKLIDEGFIGSCQAGSRVSRLLEAQRTFYHTPISDSRTGIKEHRQKVFRVLSWTKDSLGSDTIAGKSSNETFASTLDKLYAWEKKLYDEIKTVEARRLELERKKRQLKNQKDRGHDNGKLKGIVKESKTQLLVEFEIVDSAYTEVFKLRDDHLVTQLLELLKELTTMWKNMNEYHVKQTFIAKMMLEETTAPSPKHKEINEVWKKITKQLNTEITKWHSSLLDMMMSHKDCLESLLQWYEKTEQAEKSSKVFPLDVLCKKWVEVLKRLSHDGVKEALASFSEDLQEFLRRQDQETELDFKINDLEKEWRRRRDAMETLESRFNERTRGETDSNREGISRHPLDERRALVDLMQKNMEEEKARYAKMCEQNRTTILMNLKINLPNVLNSIMTFSIECRKEYEDFHSTIESMKSTPI